MANKGAKALGKNIQGQKIRTHHFLIPILILALFILAVVISAFFQNISWKVIVALLPVFVPLVLIFILFIILDIALGTLLCVLTKDQLYFFQQTFTKIHPSTGRKSKSCCDGSIAYKDIQSATFLPAKYRWFGRSRQTLNPQRILLEGNDFQLIILNGNKRLLAKIKKLAALPQDIHLTPDFHAIRHERSERFEAIWEAMQRPQIESMFDHRVKICHFSKEEATNSITLIVSQNDCESTFNIDEEGLFMESDNNPAEAFIPLSEIPNADMLFSQIKKFVEKSL